MAKQGRPIEYHADKIAKDLELYMNNTDDPMIEEFCMDKANPSKDTLYRLAKENADLSYTIKRIHDKQQVRTVRGAENGEINSTFAIFKLKQKCYGWTDKQEIQNTVVDLTETMTEEQRKAKIDELLNK